MIFLIYLFLGLFIIFFPYMVFIAIVVFMVDVDLHSDYVQPYLRKLLKLE